MKAKIKAKIKMFSAILLSVVTVFCNITPVYAATTQEGTVNASGVGLSYITCSLPSNLVLVDADSDGAYTTNFTIGVKGDIASTESVKIQVPTTIKLSQEGKQDIEGNISFGTNGKATVSSSNIGDEFYNTAGTISAELKAGKWLGSFNVLVEIIGLEPGLYDEGNNLLCTWEESGIDAEINYTEENVQTSPTSGHYVLTNNYPTTTKVVFPDSITTIGNCAFGLCTGLTTVDIPDSVTNIGETAFAFCTNLTSVTIPDNATISVGAFSNCAGLTTVNIEDAASIGDFAFQDCTNLTSVTIPDSVTSIGSYAFLRCTGLTTVDIEGGTSIGECAFQDCTNLTSVTIPNSVTTIEDNAFLNVPHIYYNGTAEGSPWGALAIN